MSSDRVVVRRGRDISVLDVEPGGIVSLDHDKDEVLGYLVDQVRPAQTLLQRQTEALERIADDLEDRNALLVQSNELGRQHLAIAREEQAQGNDVAAALLAEAGKRYEPPPRSPTIDLRDRMNDPRNGDHFAAAGSVSEEADVGQREPAGTPPPGQGVGTDPAADLAAAWTEAEAATPSGMAGPAVEPRVPHRWRAWYRRITDGTTIDARGDTEAAALRALVARLAAFDFAER